MGEGTFAAMGSAPIFLAKLPVGILSGYLLQEYCPKTGPRDSTTMWWIIFLITIPAPFLLTLFRLCLGATWQEDEMKVQKVNSSDSENADESDDSTEADESSSHESSEGS